jgi:hypothetical protein
MSSILLSVSQHALGLAGFQELILGQPPPLATVQPFNSNFDWLD